MSLEQARTALEKVRVKVNHLESCHIQWMSTASLFPEEIEAVSFLYQRLIAAQEDAQKAQAHYEIHHHVKPFQTGLTE